MTGGTPAPARDPRAKAPSARDPRATMASARDLRATLERARWTLAALLGHWRRHPVELVTLLVGLMVATALWSGVQALNAEARASYARAAAVLGADRLASVAAIGGQRFDLADYVALRREGWPVSPVLEGDILRAERRIRVIGIDPLTLPAEAESFSIGAGSARLESFLVPPNLGLATAATLAALEGAPDLPPLDVAPDLPPDTLLVDIGVAERLLGAEGRVSRLLLAGDGSTRALPGPLAERLEIRPPQGAGDLARLTDSFHLNLTAFGFLSFVVGLFIVHAAIGLAFEQRRPGFRTLRACGVSARMLAAVMLGELLAFALVAGAAGVIAGYLIASALLPDVAASLRGLYGARVPGSLSLQPSWWLAGLGMAVLGALAAGLLALWRAWRLPLLATAQPEAWHGAERRSLRVQGILASIAGIIALAALARGGGLAAGFTVMGGLLIGAALLLPAIIAGLLALAARRVHGPIAQWILADSRQQMSGLSLALMALLLALAVNIGVGTMVGSFRATFLGWLDQRLAAEVYLTARDADEAAAITAWLDARPEVRARLPIWSAEATIAGWPAEVYGFRDHTTYRDNWPMLAVLPDGWDRVAAGEAAMVSEQLARRASLAPGDTLSVPTPQGTWTVTVAGIYSDYGNPEGQIMVATEALVARWPEVERLRYALRVEPDAVAPLIGGLRETFGFTEDRLIDQAALKDLSRRIFERTFTVTLALNALTLAVAGIALLTALLTLANLRLRQLAPVWALGLTRRQLATIEMGKTLGLAGLTAVVALPLGLAVAWVLTAVVNVEAFGWRLPILLFPGRWVVLFALALATAFLAALWPVLRLRRTAPLTLLQSFTNER